MKLILFLGGTTNKSKWREDIIPSLDYECLSYYNPVVNNWTEKDRIKENYVKSLPNCVELYVISKDMKGVYSIAEAVESSNKKPKKTIFLSIKDGFDSDQIKSLNAVEDILMKNGAYIASSLHDVVIKFKEMNIEYNRSRLSSYSIDSIFEKLEKIFLAKEKELNYQEIFDFLGISSKLKEIYIDSANLKKYYRDAIYSKVKEFLSNPLFKGLDLKNKDDLEFLRKSTDFSEFMDDLFSEISIKLEKSRDKIEKYLQRFKPEEILDVQKVIKESKIDFNSLMFIFEELKKDNKIYDFNGKIVYLK